MKIEFGVVKGVESQDGDGGRCQVTARENAKKSRFSLSDWVG